MAKLKVIQPLCDMLAYKDATVVQCVLESLSNILKHVGSLPGGSDEMTRDHVTSQIEECGGLDKIEQLQTHESHEIYSLAYKIIDEYFGEGVSTSTSGLYFFRLINVVNTLMLVVMVFSGIVLKFVHAQLGFFCRL